MSLQASCYIPGRTIYAFEYGIIGKSHIQTWVSFIKD